MATASLVDAFLHPGPNVAGGGGNPRPSSLEERIDWRKSAAFVAGFVGVIVGVDPFRSVNRGTWIGYAACEVCVSCLSTTIIWSRIISQTERPESVMFISGLAAASVGLVVMLAYAGPPNPKLVVVRVVMGLLCALCNICISVALKYSRLELL